jgi:hypothetical protein
MFKTVDSWSINYEALTIILAVIIYMSKVGLIGHAVSIIYQLYAAYDAYNTY